MAMTVMRFGLRRALRRILPGLQRFHAAFDRCPGCGQGPVGGELGEGGFTARWPFEPGGDPGAGARVGTVGEDGHTLAFADPDHPVVRCSGEVMGAPGRAGRDPQWLAGRHPRAGAQPTLFHSSHRFVLKYSPLLSVTRPGPLRLLLAMMDSNSPLASFARSQ